MIRFSDTSRVVGYLKMVTPLPQYRDENKRFRITDRVKIATWKDTMVESERPET